MEDWDSLYKKKGVVQKEPSKFVKEAVDFFKKEEVNKVLDLGCGTGRHTTYLIEKGFDVYGCDSSESALEIAEEVISNSTFEKCDMTNLKYDKNAFDAVLCHFVIQHGKIADVKSAISEMKRILKKGGVLYLSVPSVEHPEYETGEKLEYHTKINIDAIDGSEPHHYFTEEEINNLLEGFNILKLKHVNFPSERNSDKEAAAFIIYAKKE